MDSLTELATWRPRDPVRAALINAVAGAIIGVVGLVDVVLNPRVVTSRLAFQLGIILVFSVAGLALWRARRMERGLGHPELSALLDLASVFGLSAVILGLGGLPPLMLLFLTVVVSNTFTYGRTARVALNLATLTVATVTSLLVQPGIGDTILAMGFMGAVVLVAEARMRDLEVADLERVAAREAARRRADLTVAAAGLRTLELDELHEELVDAVVELGFDHGSVLSRRPAGGHELVATTDATMARFPPAPPGVGLGARVLSEATTVVLEDYQTWPGRVRGRDGVRGIVAVPICAFGDPVAVLCGTRSEPGPIDPADVETLEALALHAGAALENVEVFDREREVVARLVEVDRLRDDLLSNVSHELRTPLQAITGMGETLAAREGSLDDEQRRLLLARINANAERLRDRIETLLTYSRFEAGQQPPEREPVELREFVKEQVERLQEVVSERPFELRAVGDEPIWVAADARQLEHVLENLLGNAMQHTAPGTPVTVEVVHGDARAGIRIQDRGEGLTDTELERVTQRFYRGGHPDQRDRSGLGLGLALAASILGAHGTELRVENRPGGGASFGFDLPLVPAPDRVPS